MKLCRYGNVGDERPAVVLDGKRLDVSSFVSDFDEKFFADDGPKKLQAWLQTNQSTCKVVDDKVRWASSVARPSKIICIGLNYKKHAQETGMTLPPEPVMFFKATTALSGPNDPVVLPRGSEKSDWEVELAVIIGKEAKYVEESDALDYVAGYTVHNDYSERAFQLEREGQWVKGKSADTFAPLGPFVATRDEVDGGNLDLWLKLNGELLQSSNTSDMAFNVPHLVSYCSQFMTLLPGDVISTGTPSGVGLGLTPPRFLKAGDVVECGIEGLGSGSQRIVAANV